jgi:hypothetical protein
MRKDIDQILLEKFPEHGSITQHCVILILDRNMRSKFFELKDIKFLGFFFL